MKEFLKWLVLA